MGGMGIVFKAEDPVLERFVALKAMKPALAASESARQRFIREAKATAAIKHDHRHHPPGRRTRRARFLAMEFLEGRSRSINASSGEEDTTDSGRVADRASTGGHLARLVHRRIWLEIVEGEAWRVKGKDNSPSVPSTRHASRTTRVKILDFGLARAASDAHLTQSGAYRRHTRLHGGASKGEEVDVRCDLFSLG